MLHKVTGLVTDVQKIVSAGKMQEKGFKIWLVTGGGHVIPK